jgi:hypothetical protein
MSARENANQTDEHTEGKENRPESPERALRSVQRHEPYGGEMGTKPTPPWHQGPGLAWLEAKVMRMNSGIYVGRVNVDWGMPCSFAVRVTCRAGTKGRLRKTG